VDTVRNIDEKINIRGSLKYNEPMSLHTSFQTGGPAEVFITPENEEDIREVVLYAGEANIPVFILGGGANILVADRGIKGIVIDMSRCNAFTVSDNCINAQAGAEMSEISRQACQASLKGLEFIFAMPGSVGGSVYMNARCYGKEISEVLSEVSVMHTDGSIEKKKPALSDFSYKCSPFQKNRELILGASFSLSPGDRKALLTAMEEVKSDRDQKGHFLYPCAGSVFKNNRNFGRPTGMIIDELGLKGKKIGGARVADFHGNIIINEEKASSDDIRQLVEFVEEEVSKRLGLRLEKEILYIGEW